MDNPFESPTNESMPVVRNDATLINVLTEMGTSNDKSQYTQPGLSVKFSDTQLEILQEQPLINAYCSALPDSAISKPLEFNFGSKTKGQNIDPEKTGEIVDWLDQFHVLEKTARAQTYANVYGGAAIVYFLDDGQPQDQPLDLKKLKKFLGARVLDRQKILPYIETATTLEDITYYDVSTYGMKIDIPGSPRDAQIRFHKSRIIPFYGLYLTDTAMLQRYNGWGKSTIEAIWESYRDYRTSILASSSNLGDSSLAIVSMNGFIELLRANNKEMIRDVFKSVKQMASNQGMMLIDKEHQDIKYVERQFAGVSQVIDKLREDFIGQTRIPHDKLFGESPSGLGATGEAEEKNWAKEVRQYQERRWRRLLRKQYEMLLSLPDSPLKGKLPDQWSFTFPSIIELGEDQLLTNRSTQATIDSTYQSLGILTTDEIRQSRFAGSKFSYETTLDEKAYQEAKKKAEEEAAGFGGFGGFGGEEALPVEELPPEEVAAEEEALTGAAKTDSRRQDTDDILYHNKEQYNLEALEDIALSKPVQFIPVRDLEWILDYAGALTFDRVMKANINKPVIVAYSKGRPVVIDGMHRLQQAKARGILKLPAKVLTPLELSSTKIPPKYEKSVIKEDAMRPSCMDCVTKHLGSALIKGREVENGYPEHIILVVGELSEAEQEVEAISKEAADMIRDLRRTCWAERRSPMFEEVLEIYDVLGYDWSEGSESGDRQIEQPNYRFAEEDEAIDSIRNWDSSSMGAFSRDLEHRDISPDTIIDHLGEDDYLLSDFEDEYWDEWQEYGEPPNIEGYQCVGMTIQEVPVYRLPELEPTFREDPVEISEEYNPEDGGYYSIEEDVEMPIISSLGENDRLISDLADKYWDAWQHGDGCPPRIKGYECIGFTPEDCGLEPIYRESSATVEEKFDATPQKYAHIDFTPPEGARKAAERGLEIRKQQPKSQRGGLTNAEASKEGIGSGVQRAVNLKNGSPLSPKVVKQMKAFFDRHSAFKHKHKEEPEGKARQSHLLWGGDAGYSWAKKVVAQMEAADKKERQDAQDDDFEVTPEELDLFTVDKDTFERELDEIVERLKTISPTERTDARFSKMGRKKKEIRGKDGVSRSYWVKSGGDQKNTRPLARQKRAQNIVSRQNRSAAEKEIHSLLDSAFNAAIDCPPELRESFSQMSIEPKQYIVDRIDKFKNSDAVVIDVNAKHGFATVSLPSSDACVSVGKKHDKEIVFTSIGKREDYEREDEDYGTFYGNVQVKDVSFKVGGEYTVDPQVDKNLSAIGKAKNKEVAEVVKAMWQSQRDNFLEDGDIVTCTAAEGDGKEDQRGSVYKRMGFREVEGFDSFVGVIDKDAGKKGMATSDSAIMDTLDEQTDDAFWGWRNEQAGSRDESDEGIGERINSSVKRVNETYSATRSSFVYLEHERRDFRNSDLTRSESQEALDALNNHEIAVVKNVRSYMNDYAELLDKAKEEGLSFYGNTPDMLLEMEQGLLEESAGKAAALLSRERLSSLRKAEVVGSARFSARLFNPEIVNQKISDLEEFLGQATSEDERASYQTYLKYYAIVKAHQRKFGKEGRTDSIRAGDKELKDAIARFNKKYNDSLTEEALLDDIRNDSQSPTYEWVTGYNRGDSWVPGYVRYYRDRAGSTSKKKDLTRSDAEKEDDPLLPAVEASIEKSQPVIDQWLKTLKKEIQRLGSYEAILEKLPDLAKKLPLDDLGQIFQEGNIVSHLIGLSEDTPTE